MTEASAFTPDMDFCNRELEPELCQSNAAVDRKLHTMLAALDDALAGISDAREELHSAFTLYADSGSGTAGEFEAHNQDLSTRLYLDHAESDLRAAAAILRRHRQLTARSEPPTGDGKIPM